MICSYSVLSRKSSLKVVITGLISMGTTLKVVAITVAISLPRYIEDQPLLAAPSERDEAF